MNLVKREVVIFCGLKLILLIFAIVTDHVDPVRQDLVSQELSGIHSKPKEGLLSSACCLEVVDPTLPPGIPLLLSETSNAFVDEC